MSFRFLLWMAFVMLMVSGVAGWIFLGEREKTPEEIAYQAHEAALKADRDAAMTGGAIEWVRYGRDLLRGPEEFRQPAEAMKWFRKAADQGYVPGQVELGLLYFRGLGVSKDFHRAQEWFELAARLSLNPEAHFRAGEGYFRGLGVPQDYGTAVQYYLTAARQGHPVAQYLIGSMYEAGWGVEQNLITAWVWYKRAEPGAALISAHEETYDVGQAITRIEAKMNNSQRQVAERELARPLK